MLSTQNLDPAHSCFVDRDPSRDAVDLRGCLCIPGISAIPALHVQLSSLDQDQDQDLFSEDGPDDDALMSMMAVVGHCILQTAARIAVEEAEAARVAAEEADAARIVAEEADAARVAAQAKEAAQRGGRTCVLSMSWGHARGQDNARTVLITIGRILTGQTPTKYGKRLGQGFIPFLGMTFSFEHELRNGECTALPRRRASVKGGLGARRIREHHGNRHCHVSLECLKGTVPLIDLIVL